MPKKKIEVRVMASLSEFLATTSAIYLEAIDRFSGGDYRLAFYNPDFPDYLDPSLPSKLQAAYSAEPQPVVAEPTTKKIIKVKAVNLAEKGESEFTLTPEQSRLYRLAVVDLRAHGMEVLVTFVPPDELHLESVPEGTKPGKYSFIDESFREHGPEFAEARAKTQNLLLWVEGRLDDLAAADVIPQGVSMLSRKGRRLYRRLCKSGFRPTEKEVALVLEEHPGFEDQGHLIKYIAHRIVHPENDPK